MSCDVSLQQDLIDKIQDDVYTVCNPLPTLVLTADDLAIVESGSWCGYQPTYAPVNYPAVTTVASIVKSTVYNEMMSEFNGIKAGIEGSMALNYSSKLERNSDAEALAAKIDISYSQLNTAMYAQATSFQSALTNTAYALSEQISTTEANMLGGFNAATTFYQSSLATLSDAYAEAGLLVTATNATGGKVISGFKATADTEESEFVIFADRFKVVNDLNEEAYAPFTVQNGVVYIGAVDTSQPQITYLGSFASAPITTTVNAVYKNTTTGSSYIWNGSSWVIWLESGSDGDQGLPGVTGSRGTAVLNYSADLGSVAAASVASANIATYWNSAAPSNQDTEIEGDQLILTNTNTSYGWTNIYTFNGSSWVNNTKLVVNGDAVINGTLSVDALVSSGTISGIGLALSGGNSWTTSGKMYVTSIQGVGQIISSNQISARNLQCLGTGGSYNASVTGIGSGATGVFGAGNYAIVADDGGSYGFWTAGACWFENAAYPFTGAHVGVVLDEYEVGDILVAVDSKLFSINQSIPTLEVSTVAYDKRVIGVCNSANADLLEYAKMSGTFGEYSVDENGEPSGRQVKPEYVDYVNYYIDAGYTLGHINSIGEGGVNVCNEGGDIDIGDYICSSSIAGKGMKQDDDLLHNYTVAKSLQKVVWADEVSTIKMISCTYHCG